MKELIDKLLTQFSWCFAAVHFGEWMKTINKVEIDH